MVNQIKNLTIKELNDITRRYKGRYRIKKTKTGVTIVFQRKI